MVMVAMMRAMCSHRSLHVLNQVLKGALCAGGIVRLQRGLQRAQIVAECAVVAEQLTERILPAVALQILFKIRQRALSIRQVAGLNVTGHTFEILKKLLEAVRGIILIRIGRRANAGYVHNVSIFDQPLAGHNFGNRSKSFWLEDFFIPLLEPK